MSVFPPSLVRSLRGSQALFCNLLWGRCCCSCWTLLLPLGGGHAAVQSCSLGGWTDLKAVWERGVLGGVGGLPATAAPTAPDTAHNGWSKSALNIHQSHCTGTGLHHSLRRVYLG